MQTIQRHAALLSPFPRDLNVDRDKRQEQTSYDAEALPPKNP